MVKVNNTNKPFYSISSILLLLLSWPTSKYIAKLLEPKEDIFGYGATSVIVLSLIVIFSLGLILGLISIYRGERAKPLSFLATLMNLSALIWILWRLINFAS